MTRPGLRAGAAGVLLALLGAVLTLAVGAAPAAAHDVLTATSPAAGSTVEQTPSVVVLTFDQPALALGTQVVVTGPSGPVQVGDPRLVDRTVSQDLAGGSPPGAYTVVWRVTSVDGHPVSGTFTFTSSAAGRAGPSAPTSPAGPPAPGPGPARPLLVAGAMTVVVLAGLVLLVRRRRRA